MDIREQDRAYKRGLVLGLTMAEIVILILFCLLLALAGIFSLHRERMAEQQMRIAQQADRIVELKKTVLIDPDDLRLVATLKEYWERHAPKNVDFRGYFRELVLRVDELDRLRSELEALVEKSRDAEKRADRLHTELRKAQGEVAKAAATTKVLRDLGVDLTTAAGQSRLEGILKGPGQHDWPPIIVLSEADRYHFNVGSAELSASFHQELTGEVVPQLLGLIRQYDVSVIEVVGHTDEQPIAKRSSNLDWALRRVLDEGAAITELFPADNAGLGLARAVSVARVLSSDERLSGLVILPMSGGQLIDDDRMTSWNRTGDVPARRRIEIRVRRPLARIQSESRMNSR